MPRIDAPNSDLAAVIAKEDGDIRITALRNDQSVLRISPLGIETASRIYNNMSILTRKEKEINEHYQTPVGSRREHHHHAQENTFKLETSDGDQLNLDLRVGDGLVAYRYGLQEQDKITITDEIGVIRPPAGSRGWLFPYRDNHEQIGREVTPKTMDGTYSMPALFETPKRNWVLCTESGVDSRYAAARFSTEFGADTKHLELILPEPSIEAESPLQTPWRIAIIGDLRNIVETDAVTDLGGDTQLNEQSWIKPGRVSWSWWADKESPSDPDRQRECIDYAVKQGWEYLLIDAGWEETWMPDVVTYANDRDIEVFLWTHWTDLETTEKRKNRLSQWKSWGVAGIKVDFMNSDTQERLQFYEAVLEAAAKRELLVNFHGSIVPIGLRRKWPNLLTYEGVYAAEQYGVDLTTPTHNTILPYTRNALGPMDYTPVTFSTERRRTTVGHELALSVVFESGLQHFADSMETYSAYPLAETFLKWVPVTWDETVFLGGEPGSSVAIARRSNKNWFVGVLSAGPARTIRVDLNFIDDQHEATLIRDDDEGESFVCDEFSIGSGEQLSVSVPDDGGWVARLMPRTTS